MAAINPVDLQKKLALVATPTNNTAQAQAPAGGVFGGEFKTRKEGGVEQNTQVFNSLDPQAQEIVKNVIGDKAGASPDKIAAALKAGGYEANVGGAKGSGTEKYLEITGKDGNKYRIWDIGGDNAIGTQDIKFNGALGDFKNELKATVPTNGAATHTAGAAPANAVAPLNATAPTEDTKEAKKEDKQQKADVVDLAEARKLLRARLEAMGYNKQEIEAKLDQLLKYNTNVTERKEVLQLI